MRTVELASDLERYLHFRPTAIRVHTDTSNFWRVERGDVVELNGGQYLITGTVKERGFGLDGEPKHWVKSAIDLATGTRKIVKLVFHEEFDTRVGDVVVRCYRSPPKEARVLARLDCHPNFMHGFSAPDIAGNNVRVIDFIPGSGLDQRVRSFHHAHERYFFEQVPDLLRHLLPCLDGLRTLNDLSERHGDVRPDHIIIDGDSGLLRWIDFDYEFDCREAPFALDVLGAGMTLAFVVGMGFIDGYRLRNEPGLAGVAARIDADDLALAPRNLLINLRKAYPYIPPAVNRILMHFAAGAEVFYDNMAELVGDLGDALL